MKELFSQNIIQCIQGRIDAEHDLLAKDIRKLEKLLTVTEENEPEYKEYMFSVQEARKALSHNENIINELKLSIRDI